MKQDVRLNLDAAKLRAETAREAISAKRPRVAFEKLDVAVMYLVRAIAALAKP